MNTGNREISGYNIGCGDEKSLVSDEDMIDYQIRLQMKMIESIQKYKNYDIFSCIQDISTMMFNIEENSKITSGNILEVNIETKNLSNDSKDNIKKCSMSILKWSSCKELRKIIDDIFQNGFVNTLYKDQFNIILNECFLKNEKIFCAIETLKNEHEFPVFNKNDELHQKIFSFYENFVNFLCDKNIENDILFDFYNVFEMVKNDYLPNKNNEMMTNILMSFKNGDKIIEISNFIINHEFFENFEELDLTKYLI